MGYRGTRIKFAHGFPVAYLRARRVWCHQGALVRRESCARGTPAIPVPGINLSQGIRKSNVMCALHAERFQSELCLVVLPALPGGCCFSAQAEVLKKEIRAQPLCPELRQKDLVLLEVTPESSVLRTRTALRCAAVQQLGCHRCHHCIPIPWHLSPFLSAVWNPICRLSTLASKSQSSPGGYWEHL